MSSSSAPRIRVEIRFGTWNDCQRAARRTGGTGPSPSSASMDSESIHEARKGADDTSIASISGSGSSVSLTLSEDASAYRAAVEALRNHLDSGSESKMRDECSADDAVPLVSAEPAGPLSAPRIVTMRPSGLPLLAGTDLVAYAVFYRGAGSAAEGAALVPCGCCSMALPSGGGSWYVCVRCHGAFCGSCDELVHEAAHVCPGCPV